ncbi:unnamed protein product, partial [Prorocentrum cordatum]
MARKLQARRVSVEEAVRAAAGSGKVSRRASSVEPFGAPGGPASRLSGLSSPKMGSKAKRDLVVMLKQCERTYKVLQLRRNQKFQIFKRSLVKAGMAEEAERAVKPEIQSEKQARLEKELEDARENVRSLQRMVQFWENRIKTREQRMAEEKQRLEQELGPDWQQILEKAGGDTSALRRASGADLDGADRADRRGASGGGQQVWAGVLHGGERPQQAPVTAAGILGAMALVGTSAVSGAR